MNKQIADDKIDLYSNLANLAFKRTSRGFGYIELDDVEERSEALEAWQGSCLGGRQLNVDHWWYDSSKIFVGNLPFSVDDAALAEAFHHDFNVKSAKVFCTTGDHTSFG